ncbi:AMP-binding protein [Streptomyces olivaceoviridis]
MPQPCPIVSRVAAVAAAYPTRCAVVDENGDRLSYDGLWERVRWWTGRLAALGLPPQTTIAVLTDGAGETPAVFLAARSAGLVPVLVDSLLPQGRVADVLAAARPGALVDVARRDIAPGVPAPRVLAAEAGYVVFSSGSQGTPKGIVGQAAGLVHFVDWESRELGVAPGTRVAMLTSPAFDVVFRDMLLPLCTGGELHASGPAPRSAPQRVLPFLAERGVDVVHAVPSLAARWAEAADGVASTALRWTLFAGEPLHDVHVHRWRRVAPRTAVMNLYGPSEMTLAKFAYRVPDPPTPGLQPVGTALPGTVVRLRPEGTDASDGGHVTGVDIESPFGSLGYLPDASSAQDRARLRREGGRTVFRTQDRGHLDAAGNLVIAGRLDSLVKRRGVFVDTARVEAAAVEHGGLRAACCTQAGPADDPRVVVAVESEEGRETGGLLRVLRKVLGAEAPDAAFAVTRLPLLPSGKVDRRAVRELYESRLVRG